MLHKKSKQTVKYIGVDTNIFHFTYTKRMLWVWHFLSRIFHLVFAISPRQRLLWKMCLFSQICYSEFPDLKKGENEYLIERHF